MKDGKLLSPNAKFVTGLPTYHVLSITLASIYILERPLGPLRDQSMGATSALPIATPLISSHSLSFSIPHSTQTICMHLT